MGTVHRVWTKKQDDVIRKMNVTDASVKLGIPISSVSSRRRQLGLGKSPGVKPGSKRRYTKASLAKLYKKLQSQVLLAEALGVSKQRAWQLLREYGVV